MTHPKYHPLGFTLGASLALSAGAGIFVAFWLGHQHPVRFWLSLSSFSFSSLIVSYATFNMVSKKS
ncbi:MAG: hypothetical protein R2880_19295 [Deinococcales bacterium]